MMNGKRFYKNDAESVLYSGTALYRAAGVCALLSVALVLLDMGISFAGGDSGVAATSVTGWFEAYQQNPFWGMRNLGLFNILSLAISLPLYLALYQLHRRTQPSAAALALLLFVLGASVYIANNRALAMLTLSQQYAAAATEAQQAVLTSAGAVLLAQAEDFTPGSFPGFLFSNLASLVMLAVMLRGGVFRTSTAWVGLIGSAAMLVFTISVTFVPSSFDTAMLIAMVGGLLMIAWNILVALALFRLGRSAMGAERQLALGQPTASEPGR